MESEADDDLVAFIDEFCAAPPSQLLNNEPTKDISAANLLLFRHRVLGRPNEKANQNAPQRHQKYWSFFRSLGRAMQKYNNSTLLKKLALVQKKCVPTGGETYTVSQNFLRYVGCAYIRRLFCLSKIKEYCLKTAHSSMGYLELGHWQNLTLVIVALCSEIHSHVRREAEFMAKAFQRISKYLVQIDSRFPERLEELEVFKKLTEELSSQGKSLEVATSLLKFSEEHMKKAQDQMEMEQFKKEILDDLLIESKPSQALGVAVKRDEHPFPMDFQSPGTSTQTPKPSKEPRKEALSKSKKIDLDFFLSDDFNFKTPGRSEESKESDLLSPNLFGKLEEEE
ncbi:unnamed protein product [Caenorhabditis auriculariae]|uniref:Nucleolus and neural progenitor protein-like N-terminal domain-containing protein n=1 Tax=Caenorhabditis auriculariae TaxID=2777116 RepID=A0A8S1HGW7_9PELO|nr:unnamed protein product [Caenorhabditis auriculariae]